MKGNKLLNYSILILFMVSFLSACSTHRINVVTIDRASGTQDWIINNRILEGSVAVMEVKEFKVEREGELLNVFLLLRNKRGSMRGTQVKLDFFDQNGLPFDNAWGWKPVILEPDQEEWFKFLAPVSEDKIRFIKVSMKEVLKPETME
jgi:hypothetical protein